MARSSDRQRQRAGQNRAAEQAAARAAREAERVRKTAEKQEREAYLAARATEAADLSEAVESRMAELSDVLVAALREPPPTVDFARLRKRSIRLPLDFGKDREPAPARDWSTFAPRTPGMFGRLFGSVERHERKERDARQAFASAKEVYAAAEAARRRRVESASRDHSARQAEVDAQIAKQNADVNAYERGVRDGDRHAASRYFQQVMNQVRDPDGFPMERRVGYVPESSLLAMEWRLPNVDVVPVDKSFRYIKTRDAIQATTRPVSEIRTAYQRLVAQIALRALRAAFAADTFGLVTTVVFNGVVEATDPATGRPIRPYLITLRATREHFAPLVLTQLDPVTCVRKHFAADVSPHPEELESVDPIMTFDMADPRIIDATDVISSLDKRPNLMEMGPKDFEHFVQNLFARMGLDTKLFRADGDGGVDCVAYDPTPILGGSMSCRPSCTPRQCRRQPYATCTARCNTKAPPKEF